MNSKRNNGFSLVELSIVLVIVGLLISSVITGFATFRENNLILQTQNDLKLIHEALIGFTIQQMRLPCPVDPAALNDGREDPIDGMGGCDVTVGFLPFRDLGLSGVTEDPWGNPYIYAVDRLFADDSVTTPTNCPNASPNRTFGVCDTGVLEIHDTGNFIVGATPGGCTSQTCRAGRIVAAFYSLGSNGCTGFSVHEQENFDSGGLVCATLLNVPAMGAPSGSNNQIFISGPPFANSGPNRFDDQVMWLSSRILVARMIQAGRLP